MRKWIYVLVVLSTLFSCKKDYSHLETKVLGHAGESIHNARSEYPPNTLESVKHALVLGADGVEIDVQLSIDGTLLAWHDPELDANSTGSGCVNSTDWSNSPEILVYNSDLPLTPLSSIMEYVLEYNKELMLDVKNYNSCNESYIDYATFNNSLNNLLTAYSSDQKNLITINSTSPGLLVELTDVEIKKSLESDVPEEALQYAIGYNFDMLTIKLDKMDQSIRDQIKANNIELSIFNVKTRRDIKKALQYAPEFVISDNIPCTTKALNGQ